MVSTNQESRITGLDEPDVSRDSVAHLDLNDVAGDNFSRGDDSDVSVANNTSCGGRKGTERVHGPFGRVLLEEANDNIEEDDGANHATLNPRLDAQTDSHGKDKNKGHGIGNLGNGNADGGDASRLAQIIGPVLDEARLGLRGRQARGLVGLELRGNIVQGQAVGGLGHGLVGLTTDVASRGLGLLFLGHWGSGQGLGKCYCATG